MAGKPLLTLTKKDFDVTFFSGKGAGGQHRNKHQNCVRIQHKPSGVSVTGTEQKSRIQTQKTAFRRLADHPKFLAWLKMASGEQERIEEKVKEMMQPENLKIETRETGKWKEV